MENIKFILEKRYIDIPYEEVTAIIINGYQSHINGQIYNNGDKLFNIDNLIEIIKNEKPSCLCFYCNKSILSIVKEYTIKIKNLYNDIKIGLFTNNTSFPFQSGLYDYIKLGEFDENIYNLNTKQCLYKNIDEKNNYNNCKFYKINDYLRTSFNSIEENYFEIKEQLEKEIKN